MLKAAMALSGSTLPQVSATSGSITGTWQTVTSDGTANNKAGEMFAVLDTTGTGAYSKGVQLVATSAMVGNGKGNVVQKRANNVGADAVSFSNLPPYYPPSPWRERNLIITPQKFSVQIPSGTTCTGTDATSGMSNFCLLKVVNNNAAGPFGGNVAFQIAGGATGAGNATAPAASAAKPTASSAAAKPAKAAKAARAFQA